MNSIFYDKNEEYYNSWDRTHSFSALGNYQISQKWDMNWKLSLQSGQAYTPIIGYYNQILPESPDEVYRTIPGKETLQDTRHTVGSIRICISYKVLWI